MNRSAAHDGPSGARGRTDDDHRRRRRPAVTVTIGLAVTLLLGVLAACSGDDGPDDGAGGGRGGGGDGGTEPIDDDRATTTEAPVELDPIVGPTLPGSLNGIIPIPDEVRPRPATFAIRPDTVIVVPDDLPEAAAAAELLRSTVAPSSGADLPIRESADGHAAIRFRPLDDPDPAPESYTIEVTDTAVHLAAADHDGFVWAVQTFRQMLAPAAFGDTAVDATLVVPGARITDAPRYPWRGAMLDITRHWFGPDDIRAYIDQISLYKINRLHLHLSDDQGWRIEIRSRPELTEIGSRNEVGGGPGGFLTQDDYRDLVEHAADRGVTIVPEIDTPGHTNAALVSDPELNCDGTTPQPYTGTQVGFSTLCIGSEHVYEWFDDVMRELAELTPGEWIHLGGDESHSTSDEDYRTFVTRALDIVRSHGKTPVGWDEIGTAELGGDAVVQHWSQTTDSTLAAARDGAGVILSPSARTYLDMHHVQGGPGNSWAGVIDARTAYDWDPATLVEGLDPESILGVEAPLWTELIGDLETIRKRTLPRLPALAELAWSDQDRRDWDDAARRLGAHRARWDALGWAHTDDPSLP